MNGDLLPKWCSIEALSLSLSLFTGEANQRLISSTGCCCNLISHLAFFRLVKATFYDAIGSKRASSLCSLSLIIVIIIIRVRLLLEHRQARRLVDSSDHFQICLQIAFKLLLNRSLSSCFQVAFKSRGKDRRKNKRKMSGYSFLTVVLVDLLLVNQAHLYKLPIFAKEEPGRIKFNFSPNLAGSGPAQPSSGTAHVQMPSALVNLSYEGDNTCTGRKREFSNSTCD